MVVSQDASSDPFAAAQQLSHSEDFNREVSIRPEHSFPEAVDISTLAVCFVAPKAMLSAVPGERLSTASSTRSVSPAFSASIGASGSCKYARGVLGTGAPDDSYAADIMFRRLSSSSNIALGTVGLADRGLI